MTDTGFANVEVDFVLFGATSVLTTTVDALLTKTNQTLTTTVDADLVRNLTVTVDALVVDADGTFRGSFTETDRDALPALQPQDTVITTDAAFESAGTEVAQAQYWTGAAWLSGRSMASPSSGLNRLFVAPTTAGWRVELGSPTYPVRYWNGSITRFSVDDAGNVVTTGNLSASSIDIPDDSSVGFHVDTSGNAGFGGTTPSNGTIEFLAADPGSTQYQVVVTSNIQTGGLLLFSRAGGSSTTLWTKTAPSDAHELFAIRQDGRLKWGPGGATDTDTALFRSAVSTLSLGTTDSLIWGGSSDMRLDVGNFIDYKAITVPSTPGAGIGLTYYGSADKRLHVIDENGVNTALGSFLAHAKWDIT